MAVSASLQPPLRPRRGSILRVLGIARISTEHQDVRSLDDQEALYRSFLDTNVSGTFYLTMISGRGSGECLDRAEYLRAWEEVESGQYDLVISEDLGRIARRTHAVQFCEHCVDHDTRLIAINDQIDTAADNWQVLAGFASIRHEMYNADTGRRIKRSLSNRFLQGGVVQFVIFGYVKPPGARTDAELQKDPAAAPIYDEMFRRLEDGASYAEVADWLNARGIAPGRYARRKTWSGKVVAQVVHNPILKGDRIRNRVVSKRVNKTGRRKRVATDPTQHLVRHCPHLVFIEPERYDRVIALLRRRNGRCRHKRPDGADPRAGVPRKRTLWPGQQVVCGVCGRPYHWGGHGQTRRLMCSGSREYVCWNAVTFDGPDAARRILDAFVARVEALPGFDAALVTRLEARARSLRDEQQAETGRLRAMLRDLDVRIGRLVDQIERGAASPALTVRLSELEAERADLEADLASLPPPRPNILRLPSVEELRRHARELLAAAAPADPEFGRLMRRLVPRLEVFPFRRIDSTRMVLLARAEVCLTALCSDDADTPPGLLREVLWVDLSPEHKFVAVREQARAMAEAGLEQREIARRLGTSQLTVWQALGLDSRMRELGLEIPYVPVQSPPAEGNWLRRHRHPRFRFEPLPGFPDWPEPPARAG